jgi:hypothetical protein
MSADLAAFTDYEHEFTTLCAQLPTRINTLIQYESNAEKAQAEIRRIMSDLATAKQVRTNIGFIGHCLDYTRQVFKLYSLVKL